ncbi:Nif3-like dinuclear metal center hexameric protein [Buchnera aphidicola (Taiwanaphis decaspermi)]|uniref:Nif3-like dinuclear metal center hexameric protein n=1 Tax=Buchnera aphidicola TaxID=9 RepID=UPI0031B8977A
MNNKILEKIINLKLNSKKFFDHIPNGLQIEGKKNIHKIVLGVSICKELIEKSIIYNADAIIVHHGFFWKNEEKTLKGVNKNRIKLLLKHNINLYNWHLPLDAHSKLGNNIQISKKLKIIFKKKIKDFLFIGKFYKPINKKKLINNISDIFGQTPICLNYNLNKKIKNVAWCSGAGQKFFSIAIEKKIDAFLTGEASENSIYLAKENNVFYFSLGHYASEKFGIRSLGKWLSYKYNLEVKFIDIFNPI